MRLDIWVHLLFDCLFSCLFRLTSKKHGSSVPLALCKANQQVTGYWWIFPNKGPIMWKAFPCHNVIIPLPLQWRHNGHNGDSNHQPHHCVHNRLFSADQRKRQNSASLAFVQGIHRWPVNSPHMWPVTRKMFPIDDVIRLYLHFLHSQKTLLISHFLL